MTRIRKAAMIGIMVITMGAATISSFAAAPTTGGASAPSLDELKAQRLELMKDRLEDRVEAGIITQSQADAMMQHMKEYQALCNGYGAGRMMGGYGMMGGGYGAGGQGYCGGSGQSGCPYYQAQ